MNKYLTVLIVIIAASFMNGCFVMKTAGRSAVEGAFEAVEDFAVTKNQAALGEAVVLGREMSPPLTLADIDKNDDGLYSEKEAWIFAQEQVKHEFKKQAAEVGANFIVIRSTSTKSGPVVGVPINAYGGTSTMIVQQHDKELIEGIAVYVEAD